MMRIFSWPRLASLAVILMLLAVATAPAIAASDAAPQETVGVLLFPGFEVLDAYGPIEMWGSLQYVPATVWGGDDKKVGIHIVTISATRGEVPSSEGPRTIAEFSYNDAPHLDYLVVPGGFGISPLLKDTATLNWLRSEVGKTEIVMSVCNGSSLLAAAGILDDRPATTNKMAWSKLIKSGPKVKWIRNARIPSDNSGRNERLIRMSRFIFVSG